MDYELPNVAPTYRNMTRDINVGGRYGDMPFEMLESKFEETNDDPCEDDYDDYARRTITNWGPDENKFEHEEARKSTANSGRLQLQYYGHRGNADPPAHPEAFLGFMGDEDRETRGTAVDPDFKLFKKQQESRMRFQRFTPENNNFITGGGRSEAQAMEDNQTVFKWVRDRLKVFSTQKDGRREGLRKAFKNKSRVDAQIKVDGYGDYIKSDALAPQRRHTVIKQLIRDTKWYRAENQEQDFAIAKLTQQHRRRKTTNTQNRIKVMNTDTDLKDGDVTRAYKTMFLLMEQMVKAKREVYAAQDTDYGNTTDTQVRKHEKIHHDLTAIMKFVNQQNTWGVSDQTVVGKTKKIERMAHGTANAIYNHLRPAHHYLAADILYKNLKPGADLRKIKDMIIRDATNPGIRDQMTVNGKTAKQRQISGGATVSTSHIEVDGKSATTHNYKAAKKYREKKLLNFNAEDFKSESDNSNVYKTNKNRHRVTDARDVVNSVDWQENQSKERLGGHLGQKSKARRYTDVDGKSNDVADFS